jgi:hypothetical protein
MPARKRRWGRRVRAVAPSECSPHEEYFNPELTANPLRRQIDPFQ